MKKMLSILLLIAAFLLLASCGESGMTNDIDLSVLSDTVAYAQVADMMSNADSYIGKTVKMQGPFSVYQDPATGKYYFAVLYYDSTACCSLAIEFTLAMEKEYPADYPSVGTDVTVIGTFSTYSEGENVYYELANAEFVKA